MSDDAPHVPAAHINAIAEEGTKAEAVAYLQKHWNAMCLAKADLAAARAQIKVADGLIRDLTEERDVAERMFSGAINQVEGLRNLLVKIRNRQDTPEWVKNEIGSVFIRYSLIELSRPAIGDVPQEGVGE